MDLLRVGASADDEEREHADDGDGRDGAMRLTAGRAPEQIRCVHVLNLARQERHTAVAGLSHSRVER